MAFQSHRLFWSNPLVRWLGYLGMCASLVLQGLDPSSGTQLGIQPPWYAKWLLVALACPWAPHGNTTTRQQLGIWCLPSSWSNPWLSTFGLKLSAGTLGTSCYPAGANLLLSSMVPNCLPLGQLGQAWHGCLHSGKAWWCHPSVGCSCWEWSWALGPFLTRPQCLGCSTSGQLGLSAGKQSPWDHVGLHQAIVGIAFGGGPAQPWNGSIAWGCTKLVVWSQS